jgi:hypothetical protein
MPRNSKAKQEANLQVIVREHVLGGKTQGEVAKQLGVTRQTVNENLMGSGMTQHITEVARQEAIDELKQLKGEVLSHRKGDKPLPLAAVDRLIKIAEVVMRLEGTAAPTKNITATINADVDPAKLVGYRKFLYHTRHLSEEDVNEKVFPFCDSLPPSETPQHLMVPSEAMKRGYE